MSSVARDLRAKTVTRVLEMSTTDRIALALALGDDDLNQLVRAGGLDPDEARRQLVQQRQRGRTPSRCATASGR